MTKAWSFVSAVQSVVLLGTFQTRPQAARKGHLTRPFLFLFPRLLSIICSLPRLMGHLLGKGGLMAKARFPYVAQSRNEPKEDAALHCSLRLEKSPRDHWGLETDHSNKTLQQHSRSERRDKHGTVQPSEVAPPGLFCGIRRKSF